MLNQTAGKMRQTASLLGICKSLIFVQATVNVGTLSVLFFVMAGFFQRESAALLFFYAQVLVYFITGFNILLSVILLLTGRRERIIFFLLILSLIIPGLIGIQNGIQKFRAASAIALERQQYQYLSATLAEPQKIVGVDEVTGYLYLENGINLVPGEYCDKNAPPMCHLFGLGYCFFRNYVGRLITARLPDQEIFIEDYGVDYAYYNRISNRISEPYDIGGIHDVPVTAIFGGGEKLDYCRLPFGSY